MKETPRTFDCVESMRQARDDLSAEIADMSYDDLVEWLRRHRCSDPLLRDLAEKAGQRRDADDRPAAGR